MESVFKGLESVWKFFSTLPPLSYVIIVICLAVQLLAVYFGAKAANGQSSPQTPEVSPLKWEPLALEDSESEANRSIAPYHLLIGWFTDALLEPHPTIANQKVALHRLFLGRTTPLQKARPSVKLKLSVKPIGSKNGVPVIAGIVIVRRDGFVRIEGLNPATGEPLPRVSALAITKEYTIKDLKEGDTLEVVAAVKAPSEKLFDTIKHLEPSQLLEDNWVLQGGAKQ